jgi:dihydroxy-acid dehydratase
MNHQAVIEHIVSWLSSYSEKSKTHGFVVGHITPEAIDGGTIALVQDGDIIAIDAVNNTLTLKVSDEELEARRKNWKQPALKATQGVLYKYAKCVANASEGCITDK